MAGPTFSKPKFIPNAKGIRDIAGTVHMAVAMKGHAGRGAAAARAVAPVDSGKYRASINSESGIDGGKAWGRIIARDFKARWIEFGTVRMKAFACLRRGAEAAGLKLRSGSGRV